MVSAGAMLLDRLRPPGFRFNDSGPRALTATMGAPLGGVGRKAGLPGENWRLVAS